MTPSMSHALTFHLLYNFSKGMTNQYVCSHEQEETPNFRLLKNAILQNQELFLWCAPLCFSVPLQDLELEFQCQRYGNAGSGVVSVQDK